ncbi:hypothetical protein, partial [Rhodococcus rhodochrous]|uniref:hypothetical protein n=1 Tax=Rhodococcus rhodochrous TaxID=1829 RepID=UPI001E5B87AE
YHGGKIAGVSQNERSVRIADCPLHAGTRVQKLDANLTERSYTPKAKIMVQKMKVQGNASREEKESGDSRACKMLAGWWN